MHFPIKCNLLPFSHNFDSDLKIKSEEGATYKGSVSEAAGRCAVGTKSVQVGVGVF